MTEINKHLYDVWQDEQAAAAFHTPRSFPGPVSWAGLMRKLGLTEASPLEQVAGAREWLKFNQISPGLKFGLEKRGIQTYLEADD
ncbi:hypothetical protein ACFWGD_03050 [Corynebacterium sp. NPDC060344]|uniref:hypothetical protein n=1 Tax=Corynebacterium sp. NPDC060344 TaxID=3347101 RepID=UPI0036496C8D